MTPTPTRISTPSALRSPSPAPIERFIAANTLPPTSRAPRQAGRRPERIGEQQAGGRRTGAGQGRAGQDDAEDRAGAGRPQQAGGDAEQERAADPVLAAPGRQPFAEPDQRAHGAIGQAREDQQQREGGEQDDGDPAPGAVGGDRPAAADRGEGRDAGEGDRHAGEQGQAVAQERPVGAGEDERQHRQDAGAEDGEDAAQIGEEEEQHQAGLNVSYRPLMQWRLPVGGGPSSNTWPRCPPQRRQCSSVRAMPSVRSRW